MNRKLVIGLWLACTALLPAVAIAQCATGVDTGGGNCVPPEQLGVSGNGTNGNAAPGPLWEDRWGAVVNDKSGRTGVANDERSRASAIEKATQTCKADGSANCRVLVAFRNTCVAFATGDKGYASAFTNTDLDAAKRNSLDSCSAHDVRCEVIYSACSAPVRVR
ncbi:DUF4189 domain-containing protein [Bacillus sp. NP157]|nr:DUF4189 domain-containing protein [Bacillus sp. NP157]